MKRLYSILAILMVFFSISEAQPSVKKLGKSIFTLTTFDKDGIIKSSDTYGVFVSSDGEAISLWTPFIHADSAIVMNSNGEIMEVVSIIGANELYNVCKFKVKGKTSSIEISKVGGWENILRSFCLQFRGFHDKIKCRLWQKHVWQSNDKKWLNYSW